MLPSPATGVVTRLCAAEGDSVDVGAPLVVLEPDAAGAGNGARAAAPASRPRGGAAGADAAPPPAG